MRRHYANYFKGLPNFKDVRTKLVTFDHFNDINALLDEVKETYASITV